MDTEFDIVSFPCAIRIHKFFQEYYHSYHGPLYSVSGLGKTTVVRERQLMPLEHNLEVYYDGI